MSDHGRQCVCHDCFIQRINNPRTDDISWHISREESMRRLEARRAAALDEEERAIAERDQGVDERTGFVWPVDELRLRRYQQKKGRR